MSDNTLKGAAPVTLAGALRLGVAMRQAQKLYFKHRSPEAFQASKQAEKAFDAMAEKALAKSGAGQCANATEGAILSALAATPQLARADLEKLAPPCGDALVRLELSGWIIRQHGSLEAGADGYFRRPALYSLTEAGRAAFGLPPAAACEGGES